VTVKPRSALALLSTRASGKRGRWTRRLEAATPDKDREKLRRTLLRQVDAARAGLEKALAAPKGVDPADYPPYMLPKLLEASASVLAASQAGLRALDAEEFPETDPWEAIARSLEVEEERAAAYRRRAPGDEAGVLDYDPLAEDPTTKLRSADRRQSGQS
jgi:hypothetical protein